MIGLHVVKKRTEYRGILEEGFGLGKSFFRLYRIMKSSIRGMGSLQDMLLCFMTKRRV